MPVPDWASDFFSWIPKEMRSIPSTKVLVVTTLTSNYVCNTNIAEWGTEILIM